MPTSQPTAPRATAEPVRDAKVSTKFEVQVSKDANFAAPVAAPTSVAPTSAGSISAGSGRRLGEEAGTSRGRHLDAWSLNYNSVNVVREGYEEGIAKTLDMGEYSSGVFFYNSGCSITSVASDNYIVEFTLVLPPSFKADLSPEAMLEEVYTTLATAVETGALQSTLRTSTGDNSLTIDTVATRALVVAAAEVALAEYKSSGGGSDDGLSDGALAGIIVGSIVGFCLCAGVGFLVFKKMGESKGVAPAY